MTLLAIGRRHALTILLCAVGIAASRCGAAPTSPSIAADSQTPLAAGRYDVTVSGAGVQAGGYLYRPDTRDSRPAIIVLHGWQTAGTNGAAVVEGRARRFAEEGYVSLALSMRGWPPSGGQDDCGLRQPDDVASAVRWLRTQPGVVADRIAIVGFSQGGQVALLTATRDPQLRAVVAYFPVTDVARWKTTTAIADIPSYITQVCEPGGVAPRSPVTRAGDFSAPVLLVHGDQDTRVPTEQSILFQTARSNARQPVELFLVPGAQHGFTAAEEAIAKPIVDQFLATYLR